MRRSDRATSPEDALDILSRCDVLHLAMQDLDRPYLVPLSFGLTTEDHQTVLYLHAAREGRKLELLRRHPLVCFEADTAHRLIEGETACAYTMEFESVIGEGRVEELSDPEQKRRGLLTLMAHYSDRTDLSIPEQSLDRVCVLRLTVSRLTGKRLKR
ncbi:MAG: pyridoxamine 5'-phosphate oxidase family protein [Oscillospiraceae bacterium]